MNIKLTASFFNVFHILEEITSIFLNDSEEKRMKQLSIRNWLKKLKMNLKLDFLRTTK